MGVRRRSHEPLPPQGRLDRRAGGKIGCPRRASEETMRGETSTPAYGRGVFLMIAVTLPLTLLVLSVLLWMDPEETTALPLVIANNGLGLLLIGAFPAVVVSLLHTQLLHRSVQSKVHSIGSLS